MYTGRKKNKASNCEVCAYFEFDDELNAFDCTVSLDEDEMAHYMERNTTHCPYFRHYDEYKIVQKQN